jgi:hypothetical protein
LAGAAGLGFLPGREGRRPSTISGGCIWGEPFLVVLIIFVVTMWELLAVTQTRLVNAEVSASLPRWKQGLSGAVPDVSWAWLRGCRPGADAGRH